MQVFNEGGNMPPGIPSAWPAGDENNTCAPFAERETDESEEATSSIDMSLHVSIEHTSGTLIKQNYIK